MRAMVMPHYGARLELVGGLEHHVKKGDLIRSGVLIDFNPAGLTDPVVQAYGQRLVCTNGMTAMTVLESHTLTGNQDETEAWLREAVKTAYTGLESAVLRWREMAGFTIRPQDRSLLLGGLAKDSKLSGTAQAALYAQGTEEPPETAYDVLNLMTWLTSHVLENPQRIARAQAATARFAQDEIYHKHCPTCRRSGG